MHNTGGHSYEGKVRLLDDTDDRDNRLDILQLAYMDHTMGMVIMLPRVKTNTLQAPKSWQPRNLLAATPLYCIGRNGNIGCHCHLFFVSEVQSCQPLSIVYD